MEDSTYQTVFIVWGIPSPQSNHFDVLLITFILMLSLRLSWALWISQAGSNQHVLCKLG